MRTGTRWIVVALLALGGGPASAQVLEGIVTLEPMQDMSLMVTVDVGQNTVELVFTGPADRWFAVGFDSTVMADTYAIIDEAGTVTERRIGFYNPGTLLGASITVDSNTVDSGVRTLVMTRSIAGATADHYSFPNVAGSVDMIWAYDNGTSTDLRQHGSMTRGFADLVLVEGDETPIFADGFEGSPP